MRLRRNQIKEYHGRNRAVKKNNEGSSYHEYGDPFAFTADIYPATGKLQAEIYGERITNIVCGIMEGEYTVTENSDGSFDYVFEGFHIKEGDGIQIRSLKKPDYKIISIRPYRLLYFEAEKI